MLSCPNVSVCIWQVTEHVQFNSITCCYTCKLFNSNKESQISHLSSSCQSFTSQLIIWVKSSKKHSISVCNMPKISDKKMRTASTEVFPLSLLMTWNKSNFLITWFVNLEHLTCFSYDGYIKNSCWKMESCLWLRCFVFNSTIFFGE